MKIRWTNLKCHAQTSGWAWRRQTGYVQRVGSVLTGLHLVRGATTAVHVAVVVIGLLSMSTAAFAGAPPTSPHHLNWFQQACHSFWHYIRPGFGAGMGIVIGVALTSWVSGAIDAWKSRRT